ncbi:hypothetical protein VA7868_03749 [Vibrio aerogenes CECT 7868]|uniref:Uncharacterized protein n=1 Tax=Vibrio aerogenes CECT 7868 TaxID=1216006 RepID=A0A1M6B9M5_9VIBR|nr:hypothetical protein [Vibrio aerogenes]SHI45441.1 hypothetical protein VA7868_03749 [Vibrio aerogenes CECT 7868]
MAEITDKKTYIVNQYVEIDVHMYPVKEERPALAFMFEDKKYQAGDEISLNDVQAANLIAAGFIKGSTAAQASA